MTKYSNAFLILTLFIFAAQLKAQTSPDPWQLEQAERMRREKESLQRQNEANRERSAGILRGVVPGSSFRQPNKNLFFKTRETKKRLEIDKEILVKYDLFLKSPNTGIFKLLPLLDCVSIQENKAFEACADRNLNLSVFANSYSFRERKHAVAAFGDFALNDSNLDAGKSGIQSIIVDLGDVPLEEVTLDRSKGLEYLLRFQPQSQIESVRNQFEELRSGISAEGYRYSKSSPVKLGNTYGIRSIAYSNDKSMKKSSDLVLAVKVIQLDKAGGVTFLWKELSKKNAPKLVF